MPVILRATSELVAVAWLKGIVGDIVATDLPKDDASWAETGFVQAGVVGGSASMYVPRRDPVISVDCWAVNTDSAKPPWGKANNLAETVQAGCYASDIQRDLVLPGSFPGARVLSAYTVSEPRRILSDPASYARYNLSLALHWVELP